MATLQEQLEQQHGIIREILAISNSPALSIGVLHHGEIIHTAHYGSCDLAQEHQQTPDDNTIYRVASLTKAMTASAVALLVSEGKLSWDTPIHKYLPSFAARKDEIGQKATLRDLLSNRTGLALGDMYWGQQHGEFLQPKEELVHIAASVVAVKPFRKRFVYSAWNYGLITEAVEAVTGTTLGRFIDERFCKPLGMRRTTLGITDAYENVAKGYASALDREHHELEFPEMNDGIGLAGAYGGKASIRDMLLFYQGLLGAQQEQARSGLDKSDNSPFAEVKAIFEPHIEVFGSTSYCLGLYKTVLPGILGIASLNTVRHLGLKNSPTMGASQNGLEVWHHTGNIPTCMASAFLIPETQTAVVALTNSISFMDPTDFAAQRVLAILIGEQPNEQLLSFARAARASYLSMHIDLKAKLLRGRTGKFRRPLDAYHGYFWNKAGNFCLSILPQPDGQRKGGLLMRIQDVPRTSYNLQPYDDDVWWFPPDHDEEVCQKQMFAQSNPGFHLISFASSSTEGKIDRLIWQHDPSVKAETFYRRGEKPRWRGYKRMNAKL